MPNRNQSRVLLVLCVLGLVYLSLYPFNFTQNARQSGISWHGPKIDSDWVDMLANFLAYVPVGFLVMTSLRRQNGAGVLVSTLAGGALSFGMELAQMYLPQRDSNFRDLACNAAGTLAGSLSALAVRRFRPNLTIPWPPPIAGGLILLWVGWQMFPFLPLLRRYKLHELKSQLSVWNFRPVEFGDIGLAALLLYAFTAQPWQKNGVTARMIATVLTLVLLGQSLIAGLTFSNARLAAAATGLFFAMLFWRPQRRALWIALATVVCGWVVFRELNPLQLQNTALIPAQAFGFTSQGPYIRRLAGETFLYCSLVASLHRALFLRPSTD